MLTSSRTYSSPATSTTTPEPWPCTTAKSLPKPPRHVPTASVPGTPVPGARMPRSSCHTSSTEWGARDRRQRQPHVAVQALHLLDRGQVQHQLGILDLQLRHAP